MRDLNRLRDLPHPVPPAEGLAQVLATARRRQRRMGAGAGAGALVLSTLAVFTLSGTSGSDSLRQQVVPGSHASATPRPASSASPPALAGAVPSAPALLAGRAALSPGETAPAKAGGTSSSPSRQAPSQAMHRTYSHDAVGGTFCSGTVSHATSPTQAAYCGYAVADSFDGTMTFQLEGCLDGAGVNDSAFTFSSTKEVDVALYRDGKRVWQWSTGRSFGRDPHSLALTPGDCYLWDTDWKPTDSRGRTLPHGDYEVRGAIFATELGRDNTWTSNVTL